MLLIVKASMKWTRNHTWGHWLSELCGTGIISDTVLNFICCSLIVNQISRHLNPFSSWIPVASRLSLGLLLRIPAASLGGGLPDSSPLFISCLYSLLQESAVKRGAYFSFAHDDCFFIYSTKLKPSKMLPSVGSMGSSPPGHLLAKQVMLSGGPSFWVTATLSTPLRFLMKLGACFEVCLK